MPEIPAVAENFSEAEQARRRETERLGTDSIVPLVLRLSLPATVGLLVSSLYAFVDRIFIGNFVGEIGLAAMNAAIPFMTFIFAFSILIGRGCSVIYSLALGRRDYDEAGKIFMQGMFLHLATSLVLMTIGLSFLPEILTLLGAPEMALGHAVRYMGVALFGTPFAMMLMQNHLIRAEGASAYAMVTQIVGALLNVFLDWVPSHFPGDVHGLFHFDGTSLYEHSDYRMGYHPDWSSFIFNYGRNEVRAFLISNALYWLERFHVDGIRVDAVASMLYLDYSRKEGEWIPNKFGGRENLDAISLLREMNEAIYKEFPDVQTIAEESTSWPMVSRPVSSGGLGFGMKWMMGWMNDVLKYFERDPMYRRFHQNGITFSLVYAFSENFMLPLSHDEVVHGKGSILSRMPGDTWQKFANVRTLYSWMYLHPGTKLLFMGNEFAQRAEWQHDYSLAWNSLKNENHQGVSTLVKSLNKLYKSEPALYELNFDYEGFEWVDYGDARNSIIAFYRKGKKNAKLLIVGNFGVEAHEIYELGVDEEGYFKEIFNSDESRFGGSGFINGELLETVNFPKHSRENTLTLRIPPMGFAVLKYQASKE